MARYFDSEEETLHTHAVLADFFTHAHHSLVEHARLCEELPFHLLHAKQEQTLTHNSNPNPNQNTNS